MEVLFLRFEYITQYQCRATNVEQFFSNAVNDNGKIVKFVLRSKQKKTFGFISNVRSYAQKFPMISPEMVTKYVPTCILIETKNVTIRTKFE